MHIPSAFLKTRNLPEFRGVKAILHRRASPARDMSAGGGLRPRAVVTFPERHGMFRCLRSGCPHGCQESRSTLVQMIFWGCCCFLISFKDHYTPIKYSCSIICVRHTSPIKNGGGGGRGEQAENGFAGAGQVLRVVCDPEVASYAPRGGPTVLGSHHRDGDLSAPHSPPPLKIPCQIRRAQNINKRR